MECNSKWQTRCIGIAIIHHKFTNDRPSQLPTSRLHTMVGMSVLELCWVHVPGMDHTDERRDLLFV